MQRASIVLLTALLVGCEFSGSVSDAEHISRAREFITNEDMKSASIELKNALSKNVNNADARSLLGHVYLETGSAPDAEKELSSAIRLGSSDESLHASLAKALLYQGKTQDAIAVGKDVAPTDPVAAGELWAVMGLAFIYENDLNRAAEVLASAINASPNAPYVLVAHAELQSQLGDFDAAYGYVDKAWAIDPNYAPAWSLFGRLKEYGGKPQEAIDAYTTAIDNQLYDANDLLRRATLLTKLEQVEAAQADVNALKRELPNNLQTLILQGRLYVAQGKWGPAKESFEKVISVKPDSIPAQYFLGAIHYMDGEITQANNYLSRVHSAAPLFEPATKLLALVRLKQRDYQDTEKLIEPVLAANPDDMLALNILASAQINQGKVQESIAALDRINEIQPNSAQAKMQLGIGLLRSGDSESGSEALEDAIALSPELQQANVFLIFNYLRDNAPEKAVAAAKAYSARQPENSTAKGLLGVAHLALKDYEQAESAFEETRKLAPGDPTACSNLAKLALGKGDGDRAVELYQEILTAHPDHMESLVRLAALQKANGDQKQALKTLTRAAEAHPEELQLQVLLAREYLQGRQPGQAHSLFANTARDHKNVPQVVHLWGQILLAMQEFADARDTLVTLTELVPGNPVGHFLLAAAYAGLNDAKPLRQALERTLELQPEHVEARIALTRLLLASGEAKNASKQLSKLKALAPNNPLVLQLEGIVQSGTGDRKQALDTFDKLHDLTPNTETLVYLSRAQWNEGDHATALAILEQWVAENPKDINARLELANSLLKAKQPEAAVSQYRAILLESENNLVALNNLAWNLRQTEPKDALKYAEKAYSIAPTSVMILDTLATILHESGEELRATRLIDRGLEQYPENSTLILRKSGLLASTGETKKAKALLTGLIANGSDQAVLQAKRALESLNKN